MGTSDGSVLGLTKVHDGGPAASRWNLVVVSEGFRTTDMALFRTKVDELVAAIFNTPPFDEPAVACAINIYRLEVSSTDAGADNPNCDDGGGTGSTAATYFDATFCSDGAISRLLAGDSGLVRDTVEAALSSYSSILVLVNSTMRGGAGGSVAWLSIGSGDWKEVAIHEMGHAVFGLADEYDYYATADEDGHDNYTGGEPGEPNVSAQPNPATVKWSALVTAGADSPTMDNADCGNPNNAASPVAAGIVGTFEGARYFHCDIYRPQYACMMRSTGDPFCTVCRDTIRTFYQAFAAPAPATDVSLDSPTVSFAETPVGSTMLRPATFSVEACVPVSFEVTVAPGAPFAVHGSSLVVSSPAGGPVRKAHVFFSYSCDVIGSSATDSATIRCLETGEDFVVALTGDCVARPTVAVQLVLDRSGSMLDPVPGIGDKAGLLRFSANVLVDLLYPDSGIGINAFDQDPYPMMDVTVAGPVGVGAGRLAARNQISIYAPNPSGLTAIGDGIELGKDRLDAGGGGFDHKTMIVLTDGIETASKYVADVAPGIINERVFAIGLGTAESIQPATLDALANGTGGYMLMTGAVTEEKAFLLAKYYLQILAGVTNNDIVLDPEGVILAGQVVRIPFDVVDEDMEITAVAVAGAPQALAIGLEAPGGDIYAQADAAGNPAIVYAHGASSVHMRASLPMVKAGNPSHAGRWHLLMALAGRKYGDLNHERYATLAASTGASLRYMANVYAYSNLKMRVRLTQSGLEPGAVLNLIADLTDSSIAFVGHASVIAEVTRPDDSVVTRTMAMVEPGRYHLEWPTTGAGVYRFRVTADGRTIRDEKFRREQVVTGAVWRGGDSTPERPGLDPGSGGRPGIDLCDLIDCLKKSGAIRDETYERFAAMGIDLKALLACLDRKCISRGK